MSLLHNLVLHNATMKLDGHFTIPGKTNFADGLPEMSLSKEEKHEYGRGRTLA